MPFSGNNTAIGRRAVARWWPDDDTLGWWPFGTAETFDDQTSPAYNWTPSASAPVIDDGSGTVAKSAKFVAASSQFLGQANIPTSGDAAAMIWIRFASVSSSQWLWQMRGTPNGTWGWQIVWGAVSQAILTQIKATDNSEHTAIIRSGAPNLNQWYCVGATIDNTTKTLTPYFDGTPGTPVSFAGKTARFTGVMRIGQEGFGTSFSFDGRANDALYVNRAVSAADHKAFFDGTKAYYGVS